MASTMETVATCTTVNEDTIVYAELPPGTKGYLQEKIEDALKAPDIVNIRLPDGSNTTSALKQIVMSWAIRIDETIHDFRWQYKAEVSFDMTEAALSSGRRAPIPFLSSAIEDGPGRRHGQNPFPFGAKLGRLRRPDVIIVKNPGDRWPGRGPIDHEGHPHVDNLLRLVEVKFPGDTWGRGQEAAYQQIAGAPGEFKNRMSVVSASRRPS